MVASSRILWVRERYISFAFSALVRLSAAARASSVLVMVVVAEDAAPIESKVAVARITGKRDAIVISWNVEGRNRARDAKWADPVTRAPHDVSELGEPRFNVGPHIEQDLRHASPSSGEEDPANVSMGPYAPWVLLDDLQGIFALLLAWSIGEHPGRRQITGTAGVALGSVLLGWPP
jgi:hypothetical protein